MLLSCVLPLVASGCKTIASDAGSGFEMLNPSPATRAFIVINDAPFAKQVVGHNMMCNQSPGCRKN